MRSIISLVAVCLLQTQFAYSTVISGVGYIATNETAYGYSDISSSGTLLHSSGIDDSSVGPINLGFNFQFFGQHYNQIYVSTNGLISFNQPNSSYSNRDFRTTNVGPVITPYWDDLHTRSGGVYGQSQGSPGSRSYTVQWNDVGHYDGHVTNISLQATLFESSGRIRFEYQDVDLGNVLSFGQSATIGIQDLDGKALQWSFNQASVNNLSSIEYTVSNAEVPEPSMAIIAALLGLGGFASRWRRNESNVAGLHPSSIG